MQKYEFKHFKTINETLDFLSKYKDICKVIAGGTDLTILLRNNEEALKDIKFIVDISHLVELKKIFISNGKFYIGAVAKYSSILDNDNIDNFPVLKKALTQIGSPQIRNMGTIGGNICNLSSCADSIPPLLIYNAKLNILTKTRESKVDLDTFLKNSEKQQYLKNDEIISEIIIPTSNSKMRGTFFKIGRRKGVSISRISFAVLIDINSLKKIKEIRLAAGALFNVPTRFYNIEKTLKGKKLSKNLCIYISQKCAEEVIKKTGYRWSSPYKLPTMQQILCKYLLKLRTQNDNFIIH